jgi:hypothetical protein
MKRFKSKMFFLFFLPAVVMTIFPFGSRANPFHDYFVCLPKVDPSATDLEFHIREGSNCQEGEYLARVAPQKDGTILLLPSDVPLPAGEQKELEEFKKYYGIDH